jgi:hypothetical protein
MAGFPAYDVKQEIEHVLRKKKKITFKVVPGIFQALEHRRE